MSSDYHMQKNKKNRHNRRSRLLLRVVFRLKLQKNSATVYFSDRIPTGKNTNNKMKQREQVALYLVFINFSGRNFVTGADGSGILLEEYLKISNEFQRHLDWFFRSEFCRIRRNSSKILGSASKSLNFITILGRFFTVGRITMFTLSNQHITRKHRKQQITQG